MQVRGHRHAPAAIPTGKIRGSCCTGGLEGPRADSENLATTDIWSTKRPARSWPLHRLSCPRLAFELATSKKWSSLLDTSVYKMYKTGLSNTRRTAQLKCNGTRWRTGGEVNGKMVNGVGNQYPSHYLGTWCIQHYYRWCAHLGCQ